MIVALSYLYFMLFWLIGYLGDLADKTFVRAFTEATGFDPTVAQFAAMGVWVLFVIACEARLARLTGKKEQDPTVPPHPE